MPSACSRPDWATLRPLPTAAELCPKRPPPRPPLRQCRRCWRVDVAFPPPQPPREVVHPTTGRLCLAQRPFIASVGARHSGWAAVSCGRPADAHFLGKVSGGYDNLGRHAMEFLNVAMYVDGSPPVLMETEQAHARELAALDDKGILREVTGALRRMYLSYVEPVGHVIARLGSPFQRGAFTCMPTGATHQLHTTLGAQLTGGRCSAQESTPVLCTLDGPWRSRCWRRPLPMRWRRWREAMQCGGELYEEEYTRKLFTQIYGNNGGIEEDGAEEEEWDRNPRARDTTGDHRTVGCAVAPPPAMGPRHRSDCGPAARG